MQRNRSQGWTWAKLSGHVNEENVCELFNDSSYCEKFANDLSLPKILSASVGGLCEDSVQTVLGEKSRGKTDLTLVCENERNVNVSLKKSLSGQVFLITIDHFINGIERQFKITIPDEVKLAIELFWGSHNSVFEIIEVFGKNKDYETRKHRLTAETLKGYNARLHESLLTWFRENIGLLARFCFSTGLAAEKGLWAEYVWYINKVGETDIDTIFSIEEIVLACEKHKDLVQYGTRGCGTTIQLPFGFVQWHSPLKTIPGCIQFHHQYKSIMNIMLNG